MGVLLLNRRVAFVFGSDLGHQLADVAVVEGAAFLLQFFADALEFVADEAENFVLVGAFLERDGVGLQFVDEGNFAARGRVLQGHGLVIDGHDACVVDDEVDGKVRVVQGRLSEGEGRGDAALHRTDVIVYLYGRVVHGHGIEYPFSTLY